MEKIVEQIVKRKISSRDMFLISSLSLFSVISSIVILMLREAVPYFTVLFILILSLILTSCFVLMTMFCVEYEYLIMSDELVIDKITAFKRRKNVVKLNLRNVEKLGQYRKEEHKDKYYNKTIVACENTKSVDTWYFTAKGSEGKTLILISPNDKVFGAIKLYLPKDLTFDVFVKGKHV